MQAILKNLIIPTTKQNADQTTSIISNINVASIAKPLKKENIDKIYLPNQKDSVEFNKDIEPLNILINLRNEAHRFAITFHKSRRSKEMLGQLKT